MKDKKNGDKPDYQDGFWLNKNTFIKADKAKIKKVVRKIKIPYNKSDKMIIFENAVEMMVDNNSKIIAVRKHERMGLWLDTINSVEKINREKQLRKKL